MYVTGAHVSGMPVDDRRDRSGRPVACPLMSLQLIASSMFVRNSASVPTSAKSCWQAVMIALRGSLGLRCESMKSTCTLRPPMPPLALMYFAAPFTDVDRRLEQAGCERVVDVGDDRDADRGRGDADFGRLRGLVRLRVGGDAADGHQAGGDEDDDRDDADSLHRFPPGFVRP